MIGPHSLVQAAFDWHVFQHYVFPPDGTTIKAMGVTLYVSVISQALGVAFGLVSALMQMSRFRLLRYLANIYVWFVRGTPLIVQIFFFYFGADLLLGITLFPRTASAFGLSVSGAIIAGIAALSFNEGAYMSEIIRAGIKSVDSGQLESARALGMRYPVAMRRVVLPQAVRVIIPPLGNEFNNMLKSTSLLSFIGVTELFNDANERYSATFQPVEFFFGVALLYLVLTTMWTFIQVYIEKRLAVADFVGSEGRRRSVLREAFKKFTTEASVQ